MNKRTVFFIKCMLLSISRNNWFFVFCNFCTKDIFRKTWKCIQSDL